MAEIDRWNFEGGDTWMPSYISLDGRPTTIHKDSEHAIALRALVAELSAVDQCYPDPHDHEDPCPHAAPPVKVMPTPASFCGSSKARQEIGHPGHCDECVAVGHVRSHPELGCGDVGCNAAHDEDPA